MTAYPIDVAATKHAPLGDVNSLTKIEADSAEHAVVELVTKSHLPIESDTFWVRVVMDTRYTGKIGSVLPVYVDRRLARSALGAMAQTSGFVSIGEQTIEIEATPLAMKSKRISAEESVWNEREVEICHPNPNRIVIRPRQQLIGVLIFLALCNLLMLGAFTYAFQNDNHLNGVFLLALIISLPTGYMLWLYFRIPQWRFCRDTGRLTYKRFTTQLEIPLSLVIGVQTCCGGLKLFPRVYEWTYTADDQPVFGPPVKLRPTFQLNLLLDDATERRLPLTEQSDFDWIRNTAQQLTDFLSVPLIDTCGEAPPASEQ